MARTAGERCVPESAELAAIAMRLAVGAARIVRDGLRHERRTSSKSTATDLVTETDRRTERWLIARLAERRPADAVLGEEGGDRSGSSGVRWVLDPIDGTVNFVLGLPQFAVSIAAEVDGVAVAGAVCNPATRELFHARRGAGAYLGRRRLTGPRDVPLAGAVVGTGFGYDAARRRRQAAVVAELIGRVADIRRLGAASLDLCAVADSRLDAYYEAGLNPWDRAAGVLIAEEAGCMVTGLRDTPPNDRMTAVAGTGLAASFFALLSELNADAVVAP